jgi:hypothetical protein
VNELLPTDPERADAPPWEFRRAIPDWLQKFGRYPNVDEWYPGDLILTRELRPDTFSDHITSVQKKAGYRAHSVWTHAAIYLGDGWRVCEATVDGIIPVGDVRLGPIWQFCDGKQALRVRRPKASVQRRDLGWLMVIEAVQRLREKYDVAGIVKLALSIKMLSDDDFWVEVESKPMESKIRVPLVCSTLYADVFTRVTRMVLGEFNGMCMPGFLSIAEEFDDVPLYWRKIAF